MTDFDSSVFFLRLTNTFLGCIGKGAKKNCDEDAVSYQYDVISTIAQLRATETYQCTLSEYFYLCACPNKAKLCQKSAHQERFTVSAPTTPAFQNLESHFGKNLRPEGAKRNRTT